MEGYTKLKGAEIAASTVWSSDPRTRLLFICLLIAADDNGFVPWPGTNNVRLIEDFGLGKEGCVDGMERLIELGMVKLEPSGTWLVKPERFRERQTKKQAMAASRVRQYRQRKDEEAEALPVTKPSLPVTKPVTRNRRGSVIVRRDGTYEDSKDALHVTKGTNSTSTNSTSTNSTTNTTNRRSRSRGPRVPRPHGVGEEVWKDYLQLRQMKKAPVTEHVINLISGEAAKAGISLEEAMSNCVSHGWAGFKADWINKRSAKDYKSRVESKSHEAGEIDF